MAYNQPIMKLTFGGSVADEDIWTNGLSIGGGGAPDFSAAEVFGGLDPVDFAAVATTFYVNGSASMNSYNTLDWIKMALVGEDGLYTEDAKIYDFPTPLAGGGAFAASPHDTVVLSLLTGVKRGLARRGRIYLPAGFGAPVATTGRLAPASTDTIAKKGATFIRAIDTILRTVSTSADVCVASSVGEGMTREVIAVEVGNLVDNQSRRRNRLFEVYDEEPIVPLVP